MGECPCFQADKGRWFLGCRGREAEFRRFDCRLRFLGEGEDKEDATLSVVAVVLLFTAVAASAAVVAVVSLFLSVLLMDAVAATAFSSTCGSAVVLFLFATSVDAVSAATTIVELVAEPPVALVESSLLLWSSLFTTAVTAADDSGSTGTVLLLLMVRVFQRFLLSRLLTVRHHCAQGILSSLHNDKSTQLISMNSNPRWPRAHHTMELSEFKVG